NMAAKVAEVHFLRAVEANQQVPGAVPDLEVRQLKLEYDKAMLSIELANHDFAVAGLEAKRAEAQLKMYRIEAPFDGIVTQIYKRKGEAVRQGDPILELANTDRVRVEGRVSINDVWRVKPGMAVQVRLDIPDVDLPEEKQVFPGRVVFVDVAVQPVTREVRVWAEVENHDNILKDGLTAVMTIDTSSPVAQADR
ncbi:MAG TPA: HlyD family efflux transporter periplasmic adaptor subunit, partial [Planctomycetaceae bacterium]|nr:HlyD family efflux transporter periplasmic adaptor subunit [Planctomycetaceae bacterium]